VVLADHSKTQHPPIRHREDARKSALIVPTYQVKSPKKGGLSREFRGKKASPLGGKRPKPLATLPLKSLWEGCRTLKEFGPG